MDGTAQYSLLNKEGANFAKERMDRATQKRKNNGEDVIVLVEDTSDDKEPYEEQEIIDLVYNKKQSSRPAKRLKNNNYEPVDLEKVDQGKIDKVYHKLEKVYHAGRVNSVFVNLNRLVQEETGTTLNDLIDRNIFPLPRLTRYLIQYNWVKI